MKKLLIIAITIILIIGVIGTCYALFVYRSDDIVVDLSTETSVSLKITDGNGSSLTLNTTNFSPENPIIKNLKLTNNKVDIITASGNGKFKIGFSGYDKLIDYINANATLESGKTYSLDELKQGILFDLSHDVELTLNVFFKEISLDEYVTIAQKTVYITLTWELDENTSNTPITTTPEIESGYYILGTFNDWTLDKDYKMDVVNKGNIVAQKEEFTIQASNEFKVVKYNSETQTSIDIATNIENPMGIAKGENGTIEVTISQPVNIYIDSNDECEIKPLE